MARDDVDAAGRAAVDDPSASVEPGRVEVLWTLGWRLYRGLGADLLLLRAAGMAYATLAALVPLLLLIVGVLDASGLLGQYAPVLEDVVFRSVLGDLPEVRDALIPGLRTADLSSLGVVGVVGLVLVAGRLVMLVEDAYGATFGVPGNRSWTARLALLLVVTLGAPVALALVAANIYDTLADVGASSTTASVALVQFIVLVVALKVLPATRVRWMPAFLGAFISTLLLGLCAAAFQMYVLWFASGNPVRVFFGSLGVLPVFLLWLYLVWVSILIGVEAGALIQYRRAWSWDLDGPDDEGPPLDVALAVLGALSFARSSGRPLVPDEDVTAALRLPPRVVGAVLAGWEQRRVVTRSAEGDIVLVVGDDAPLARLARRWREGEIGGSSALARVREELDARIQGTLGEAAERWRREGTFSTLSTELTASDDEDGPPARGRRAPPG